MANKRIVFTVSNDLVNDQRMQRICTSLSKEGHNITLIGRLNNNSLIIDKQLFKQIRLKCLSRKGFVFYSILNIRLFFKLLTTRFDIVCGIDLDTILPCIMVAKLKGKQVYYDAHELFPESEEISNRPKIKAFWERIEHFAFKYVDKSYTVSDSIAVFFEQKYNKKVSVIRNLPLLQNEVVAEKGKYLLYQGALNAGRGLEQMLLAMIQINMPLYLAGDGDIRENLEVITKHLRIQHKVVFLGKLPINKLKEITNKALIGINLLNINSSESYRLSLGNKTFDYIQSELPSICIDFPEYSKIVEKYHTAFLIHTMETKEIVAAINDLIYNSFNYNLLKTNCQIAKKELCWEKEEPNLIEIYI